MYENMMLQFCIDYDPQLFNGLQNIHFGFRSTHNLLEEVHALTCAVERAREFKCKLVMVKCDSMKAFDRIKHSKTPEVPEHYKIHPTVVRAVAREAYSARCAVRMPEGLLTDDIPQSRGVRQGGCSSPVLFVLAFLSAQGLGSFLEGEEDGILSG